MIHDHHPGEMVVGAGAFADDLLPPAAVALRFGVTTKTLQRWRTTGDGPPFIRGSPKVIRYRGADIEAFVAARKAFDTVE